MEYRSLYALGKEISPMELQLVEKGSKSRREEIR